jgi:ATP-dependent Zn protease
VINLSRVLFCTNVLIIPCFFLLDLANLVNIAAIKAAVDGADKLTSAQLEFAKDRIIMGTERKTMFISDESRKACQFFCFSFS